MHLAAISCNLQDYENTPTRSNEDSISHSQADSQPHPAEHLPRGGVCDAARVHASQWQELRGAVPPRRNTFSNANQHRDPTMMETLYWKMLDYLGGLSPELVGIRKPSVLARFRKRRIRLLDSSTIQLVLNSIDWARHRARKAAAKLHLVMRNGV